MERRRQRAGEGRVAVDDRAPAELDALAMSLLHQLEAFGSHGERVFLAVDVELALEGRLEFGRHGILFACCFSSGEAASVCRSPTDLGKASATCLRPLAGTRASADRVTPLKVASMR